MVSNQKGRTMLEVIMVFAIVGVLTISIVTMVSNVIDKYKLSTVGSQIQSLRRNISNRYMAIGSYIELKEISKDNIKELAEEGTIAKNIYNGGAMTHAFGGAVQIDASADGHYFKIGFLGLNKKTCVELAILDWKVDDTSNLYTLLINSKLYAWEENRDTSNIFPLSVEDANKACVGDSNNLVWSFL